MKIKQLVPKFEGLACNFEISEGDVVTHILTFREPNRKRGNLLKIVDILEGYLKLFLYFQNMVHLAALR